MRIIAGERRGKKLLVPEDQAIRPTSDRARESIFNIIAHQSWLDIDLLDGTRVLDLACGTGALAAEALSRGAVSAVLYDNHAPSLKLATQNIAALGYSDRARVEYADLARLPAATAPFDLIFCDPPYKAGLALPVLEQLQPQGYLKAETLLVLETGTDEKLVLPAELCLMDSRRYGAAQIWFIALR